jgi:DNA-binding response OmpR family regulator/signal transduction histidine kinase
MSKDGKHLLLVEDTAQHQELMLKTLAVTHPGWVVDSFWSGEDALEAARKTAYDAAVLDFTLPGITGLDVARELHRRVPDMPMVLVTARGSEKIAAQALRLGVSEYLIKEGEYLELLPLAVSKAIESVEAARDRERMRKDLIRRTEELSALNGVSAVVAASLSVEDVLADALDRTLDVIGAEAGAIYVVDTARRRAEIGEYQGIDTRTLAVMQRWTPTRSSSRRLLEDRRAVTTLAEVFRLANPEEAASEEWIPLETFVAVPLRAGNDLVGLLCARPVSRQVFSEEEQNLLAALGKPIAMAMANARLFQQTREQLLELQEGQQRLVAAARSVAAQGLAIGTAGEINNAMTAIRGSAQVILREKELPSSIEGDVLRILEGCDRVMRLSESLTSMVVHPDGRKAPHSVNRSVSTCVDRLRQSSEALGIAVVTNLAPRLPTVSIEGDALEQALLNVMINAIEAMPNGGKLSISTGLETDMVVIAVTDTGEGIPADHIDRIFDPDFTTRRDRGRVRGLGLGLFATQNLVQSRGGTISVRSELGRGTTLIIRLPATRSTDADGITGEYSAWTDTSPDDLISEAGLVLNTHSKQVAVGRGRVEGLTKMEARLLETFMRNVNKVLNRQFLMKEVWETDYWDDTRTIDVHVHWLRQKIEENPNKPRLLRTVRRVGYRFGRTTATDNPIDLDIDLSDW